MRDFKTGFGSPDFLKGYHEGVLSYKYKDRRCLKSPIDIAIYLRLIHDLRPGTIVEIGSKEGGSAILFRDFASLYDLDCHVWSVDIDPPQADGIHNVTFLEGDVNDLNSVLNQERWRLFRKPVLAIDDSSHCYTECIACLEHFNKKMETGDFLVIEDGVLTDLGREARFDGGPNRAITEFMTANTGSFVVAAEYCDMFGKNVTYNPNGYLRKV